MTDRFSPREEVEFNKAAYEEGFHCRAIGGDPRINNPYLNDPLTSWLDKSFRAGYAEADIDPDAPWNANAVADSGANAREEK